jgi:hypothetical protein
MSDNGATPGLSGSTDRESVVDYSQKKKRRILMLLLGYSALLGILSAFLPEEDAVVDFVVGLPLLILALVWCQTDANERGHRMGGLMKFSLVLLFGFAFPIYLLQTRGLHAVKTLLLTVLLVVGMLACLCATACATVYIRFWIQAAQ